MATYKIKGKRYLKKYTAPRSTPVYAAAVEAQAIVDRLCDVAWEESPEPSAGMAYHTSDEIEETGKPGFDSNTIQREHLDAAAWCAGHSGGQHRAYANAACYVFALPDMQTYPSLSSIKVKVTSDPYNSSGVRIAIHTNSTGEIPVNCATARTGAAHVEGFAPRTVETVNGTDYWYPTTADCTISPEGGLQLQKYLLVVVALEDYSTVRGNWIEGSAYINPQIEITTSGSITGWTDGGTADALLSSGSIYLNSAGMTCGLYDLNGFLPQRDGGTGPDYLSLTDLDKLPQAIAGCDVAVLSKNGACVVRKRGDDILYGMEGYQYGDVLYSMGSEDVSDATVDSAKAAVRAAYGAFFDDKMVRSPNIIGASFLTYTSTSDGAPGMERGSAAASFGVAFGEANSAPFVAIYRKKLLVPFTIPRGFSPRIARFSWTGYGYDGGALSDESIGESVASALHNVWLAADTNIAYDYSDQSLQRHELFTAEASKVGAFNLLRSYATSIHETEAKAFDVALPSLGAGPHVFLLTLFFDQDQLSFLTSSEEGYDAEKAIFYTGSLSQGNMMPARSTTRRTLIARLRAFPTDGPIGGMPLYLPYGWAPRIELIS